MQTNTKSLIRGLVIGGFGVCGLYELFDGIMHLSRQHDSHWAVRWLLLAPVTAIASGVLLAVSYFTYARQYRYLYRLTSVVAGVAAFVCIASVPEWLGIVDWGAPRARDALSVIDGLVSIVALYAAWYGARWVYRRAQRVLSRFVQPESHHGA